MCDSWLCQAHAGAYRIQTWGSQNPCQTTLPWDGAAPAAPSVGISSAATCLRIDHTAQIYALHSLLIGSPGSVSARPSAAAVATEARTRTRHEVGHQQDENNPSQDSMRKLHTNTAFQRTNQPGFETKPPPAPSGDPAAAWPLASLQGSRRCYWGWREVGPRTYTDATGVGKRTSCVARLAWPGNRRTDYALLVYLRSAALTPRPLM
eukprot:353090-Chlamydomonas_euryale.AAC.7